MTCQNRFLFVVLLESIDFIVCVHLCKGEVPEDGYAKAHPWEKGQ